MVKLSLFSRNFLSTSIRRAVLIMGGVTCAWAVSAHAEDAKITAVHPHKVPAAVGKRLLHPGRITHVRGRRGWNRRLSARHRWPSFEYYLAQKKLQDEAINRRKAELAQRELEKHRAPVLITHLNPVQNAPMADKVLDQRGKEAPPSVESQHFFGNWGGIQPWLVNHGINFQVSVNEEFAGNITGGRRRTSTITGQVGVQLDIDWDKLAGLQNFKTHTIIVNGHGQNAAARYGDNIAAAQEIYGARGNVIAHLVAMYGERSFFHDRLDISAGWMPVGSFFAASPLYCAYMNVAICGNPAPNKYTNGTKDWPSGNLGFVARVMPTDNTYIMSGLFAVSPHAYTGGISGWSWAQSGLGKFSSPVEIGWIPHFGKHRLVGHYKLGYAYDNSRVPNLYKDIYGHSWQATGQPRRYQAGQNSAWLMVDQMLMRNGPGDTNGLILLAGAMYSDGKTVAMRDHTWVGLMDTGADWGRPLDTIGIMWQHFDMSSTVMRQQESSMALGLPFQSNQWGGVYGLQSHENVYEMFYSLHVARAMAIQPDFQYIQRPNASTVYHDAAVLGVQFSVVL